MIIDDVEIEGFTSDGEKWSGVRLSQGDSPNLAA